MSYACKKTKEQESMKKIVQVTEVDGEGLNAFLGKRLFVIAQSFFYEGLLTGVNTDVILLEDASIVLDSGDFAKSGFTYSEKIPGGKCYVLIKNLEAFFDSKK